MDLSRRHFLKRTAGTALLLWGQSGPISNLQAKTGEALALIERGYITPREAFALSFDGKYPVATADLSLHSALDQQAKVKYVQYFTGDAADASYDPKTGKATMHVALAFKNRSEQDDDFRSKPAREKDKLLAESLTSAFTLMFYRMTPVLVTDALQGKPTSFNPDTGFKESIRQAYGSELYDVLTLGETSIAKKLRHEQEGFWNRYDSRSYWDGAFDQHTKRLVMREFLEVAINTFPQAHKVPETRTEVYAAMAAAGLTPPPKIDALLRQTDEGKRAFQLFNGNKPRVVISKDDAGSSSMISNVNALTRARNEMFWDRVIPAYYGDLLTVLGHRNGRKAMGIDTPDFEPVRAFLDALRHPGLLESGAGLLDRWFHPHKETPPEVEALLGPWYQLARDVPPAYAGQVYMEIAIDPKTDKIKLNMNERASMAMLYFHEKPIREFVGLQRLPKERFPAGPAKKAELTMLQSQRASLALCGGEIPAPAVIESASRLVAALR